MVSLLFSFHGRINRLQYWLGSLGVGFAAMLALFLVGVLLAPQAGASKEAALAAAPLMLIMMGLVGIVMGWSGLALQVKRFHDRNQPGWLTVLPLIPAFGMSSAIVGGMTSGQSIAQVVAAMQPYMLALWAINLFFFINLGCLGGTDGPNKYGPPPSSPPSPSTDPAPRKQPSQPQPAYALGGVEAAMERAIAEKARQPGPQPARAAMQMRPAPAAAGGAPSFGRRTAR